MAKRKLISAKSGTGNPPLVMDIRRWRKMGENTRRAERLTGIAPITAEGWETVAVILMDKLKAAKVK